MFISRYLALINIRGGKAFQKTILFMFLRFFFLKYVWKLEHINLKSPFHFGGVKQHLALRYLLFNFFFINYNDNKCISFFMHHTTNLTSRTLYKKLI